MLECNGYAEIATYLGYSDCERAKVKSNSCKEIEFGLILNGPREFKRPILYDINDLQLSLHPEKSDNFSPDTYSPNIPYF